MSFENPEKLSTASEESGGKLEKDKTTSAIEDYFNFDKDFFAVNIWNTSSENQQRQRKELSEEYLFCSKTKI